MNKSIAVPVPANVRDSHQWPVNDLDQWTQLKKKFQIETQHKDCHLLLQPCSPGDQHHQLDCWNFCWNSPDVFDYFLDTVARENHKSELFTELKIWRKFVAISHPVLWEHKQHCPVIRTSVAEQMSSDWKKEWRKIRILAKGLNEIQKLTLMINSRPIKCHWTVKTLQSSSQLAWRLNFPTHQ